MMPRTTNSPTRERLLDAAQKLVLSKGFTATSVDDICTRAKLTKGSFFHYFDSKDALAEALLERFCARGAALHEGCCATAQDPKQRVFQYLDELIQISQQPEMQQGCLLGMLAQEMGEVHSRIRGVCAKGFAAWQGRFAQDLADAKTQYAARAEFDPQSVAEHLIAVVEGSLILAKVKRSADPLTSNLKHFRRYVESLLS